MEDVHHTKNIQQTQDIQTKDFIMVDKSIAEFHTSSYIPDIEKRPFYLPHVSIIGVHNFGGKFHEEFKHLESFQDMLFFRDYAERLVASFTQQI